MLAGGHLALDRRARVDVDDVVKKECLSMLTAEVSANQIFVVREMDLARAAAVDLGLALEVGVVRESHFGGCEVIDSGDGGEAARC